MNEIECIKCIYNINNECKIGGWTIPKVGCPDGKAKPMSNADRIRSMTDEEMAGFMFRTFGKAAWCLDNKCPPEESCIPCWLEWLKQESGK